MLFAGGVAIPAGGLRDYIDANDPCKLNPNDPICQLTAQDVANDPCKANPLGPNCQATIVQQSSSLPTPGANDSQWNSFVQDVQQTPKWVEDLLNRISGTPTVTGQVGTGPKISAGLVGGIKTLVVLSLIGGVAFFGYKHYEKRKRLKPSSAS